MKNHNDMSGEDSTTTLQLLAAAYRAWSGAAHFRKMRLRNKNFTYGRQLEDAVTLSDGRVVTERESIIEAGREPLSNNLMRQLVKSVVGRFRDINRSRSESIADKALKQIYTECRFSELDSRALEEFLISGVCVQKVDIMRTLDKWHIGVENVSPVRFFINAVMSPLVADCEVVGQLHDMSVSEMILQLSPGDRALAHRIRTLYSGDTNRRVLDTCERLGLDLNNTIDFWHTSNSKCRVIEVWTRETREVIRAHDYRDAQYAVVPVGCIDDISRENRRRKRHAEPAITAEWGVEQYWHCRWITPMGDLIVGYDSPYAHHCHPYVVKMYPLIDGEVHAFVEDVIDQQKYVNRLISLIDQVMNASAKGVLLYPADALPTGFSWGEVQRRWASPSGIIPYDGRNSESPRQVSGNATNIGAYELLSLEMKLFDEVSGVAGSLRGREASGVTGSELYKEQLRNATTVLNDVFDTFADFQSERDRLLRQS